MPNSRRPAVLPLDWIFIGKLRGVQAVVCELEPQRVHVVYLDNKNHPMEEWAVWRIDRWTFEKTGPCGGYAEQNPGLEKFVSTLRRGPRMDPRRSPDASPAVGMATGGHAALRPPAGDFPKFAK